MASIKIAMRLEAPIVVVEEVFKGWAKEVEDHCIIDSFHVVPLDIGDPTFDS